MENSLNLSNKEEVTIEIGEEVSIHKVRRSIDFGKKIVELEDRRLANQYLLPDKQEVIGVLNDSVILIMMIYTTQLFYLRLIDLKLYKVYI